MSEEQSILLVSLGTSASVSVVSWASNTSDAQSDNQIYCEKMIVTKQWSLMLRSELNFRA